jgi:ppGpp synthetase/RelA/SpoT-type nucleotidyltranferase
MSIAEVGRRYRDNKDIIDSISQHVEGILRSYCDERNYPFVGRKKNVASLSEKLETGQLHCWSEVDDLYACTVVIPTLTHECDVLDFLRRSFQEVTTKGRGSTIKSPDVFRFEATRFIGKRKPRPGLSGDDRAFQMRFEVQIRTAFEHAWSAATHSLVYKSGDIDWKRKRMAAQLKAAAEQLDTLVLAFDKSAELIIEHPFPNTNKQALVIEKMKPLETSGKIPLEQKPENWSRFSENFVNLVWAEERTLGKLKHSKVDEALDIVVAELGRDDRKYPLSVSLLQFCIGALSQHGWFERPLKDYSVVVTQETKDHFPASAEITPAFDFNR